MAATSIEIPLVVHKKQEVRHYLYLCCKRLIDILVSGLGLLMIMPLLIIVALLIKMTSKGSALYWQQRVGVNGSIIQFPKFRSMVQNADALKKDILALNEHQDGHTFKVKADPRITLIGKIIRKFSIDELPQLWLVLKGDMTLVGPRPAMTSEVENYSELERQRLLVKPGLTCIWQVSGRGDVAFNEQLKMDIDYINKRSLWMDIKLLIATVPAVLTGKGAY